MSSAHLKCDPSLDIHVIQIKACMLISSFDPVGVEIKVLSIQSNTKGDVTLEEENFLIAALAFGIIGAFYLPAAILAGGCLLTWLVIKAKKGSRLCKAILVAIGILTFFAVMFALIGFLVLLFLLLSFDGF